MLKEKIEEWIDTNNFSTEVYKEMILYVSKLCTIQNRNHIKDEISTAVVGDLFIAIYENKIKKNFDDIKKFLSHQTSILIHYDENNAILKRILPLDITELSEKQQLICINLNCASPIGVRQGYKNRTEELIGDMRKFAKTHTTREFAERYCYTFHTAQTVKSKYKIKCGKLMSPLEIQKEKIFEFCKTPKTQNEIAEKFGVTQSAVSRFCKKYNIEIIKRKRISLEDNIDYVIEVINKSKTLKEASEIIGCEYSWLSKFMQKHAIKKRR